MADTPLRQAINFLVDLGFFDTVLPFLLFFTVVFGILEKTKILGTIGDDGKTPKKNLNAMVAFVFALLVIATQQIVSAVNSALPKVAFVLIIIISFMMLAGAFLKTQEFSFESGFWRVSLTIVVFIGILLIFLGGIETENGETWLQIVWDFANEQVGTGSAVVWTFLLLFALVVAIYFVLRPAPGSENG